MYFSVSYLILTLDEKAVMAGHKQWLHLLGESDSFFSWTGYNLWLY